MLNNAPKRGQYFRQFGSVGPVRILETTKRLAEAVTLLARDHNSRARTISNARACDCSHADDRCRARQVYKRMAEAVTLVGHHTRHLLTVSV